MKLFNKILIANRGEIAVRIIKSAKKLGIKTVAIYSAVDNNSLHVHQADEAYCLGQQELSETYLNIEKIIDVASKSGAEAIHPGYGFLAENSSFVEACDNSDIVFIGPHTKAIRLMGNKIESRAFVSKLGIPMTKGITGDPKELLAKSNEIPYPILVKAAAGGGGKGMRIVHQPKDLADVLESTSREAKNYFGDGTIYIEKYVEEPRHIEFQILGDNFGNVIHLFERECTIQRRYQKIIEESPSPTLTPEVRKKMGDAAVKISKEIEYNSAGTMEFLVDKDLNFYFLEMNTRIQVEHPVTEMVTGVDLVEEQISVAAGNKLRLQQKDIHQNGHAIECRIYAEDPENNFLPSPGKMSFYHQPKGEHIRIDSAIEKATEIYSFFDPMIAKMIVWADDREKATKRSVEALKEFVVHGIKTNISYLLGMLSHKAFETNQISTKFCDEHTGEILNTLKSTKDRADVLPPIIAFVLHTLNPHHDGQNKNVWEKIGYWRNIMEIPVTVDEVDYSVVLEKANCPEFTFIFNDDIYSIKVIRSGDESLKFSINDKPYITYVSIDNNDNGWVTYKGQSFKVKRDDLLSETDEYISSAQDNDEHNLFAPMPGKVIKVNVGSGDQVKRGTILLVVEAMKMENNITAVNEAIVKEIAVKEGDMVDTDVQLIFLENIKEKD